MRIDEEKKAKSSKKMVFVLHPRQGTHAYMNMIEMPFSKSSAMSKTQEYVILMFARYQVACPSSKRRSYAMYAQFNAESSSGSIATSYDHACYHLFRD
jgi:hypothetical protein